ncbi:MAG: hypothetical protein QOJ30_6519 [Pseudonocardiales bacterium]|nr:hypothetical protein [Pseudonocardiales bacterium]
MTPASSSSCAAGIDIQHLRYFVAVAEEGGFRAASRRLHVTQPPVSSAIRQLERQLGRELLIRSSRGVELTAAGIGFLEHVRDLLARLDAAVAEVRDDGTSEPLRVGVVGGLVVAAELTVPILTTFSRNHPLVHVALRELHLAEPADALLRGDVDVAIVRAPIIDAHIETVAIFSEPLVLLVPTTHRLAEAGEVGVEQALTEVMLHLTRTRPEWSSFWLLDAVRGEAGPRRLSDAVTINETQFELISEGAVLAVAQSVARLCPNKLLVPVTLRDAPFSTVAVARRRGNRARNVEAFIRHARRVCGDAQAFVPDAVSL